MSGNPRRVLVTGASKGIGRSIAVALYRSGFDVVCHYNSDLQGVMQTIENMGANSDANIINFDLRDSEQTESTISRYIEENGAFWGVVLNAGIKHDQSFLAMSQDEWSSVIDTNLNGFFSVLKPLVHPMVRLRDGGRIVCVSSLSGAVGVGGQVNYSASKGGLEAAARSLAMELAGRNITVNSVCPGFIDTDMISGLEEQTVESRVPMKRIGKVEEVASLVDYLFSDSAAYITKQSIRIDGGIG